MIKYYYTTFYPVNYKSFWYNSVKMPGIISIKETAAMLYKEEKVSLARAAGIVGVSLIGMKEI